MYTLPIRNQSGSNTLTQLVVHEWLQNCRRACQQQSYGLVGTRCKRHQPQFRSLFGAHTDLCKLCLMKRPLILLLQPPLSHHAPFDKQFAVTVVARASLPPVTHRPKQLPFVFVAIVRSQAHVILVARLSSPELKQ